MKASPSFVGLAVRRGFVAILAIVLVSAFVFYVGSEFRSYSERQTSELKDAQVIKTQNNAHQIDALMNQVSSIAIVTANILAVDTHMNEAELYGLLERNVGDNPLVYGAAIAFEPGVFPKRKLFAPYVYRSGGALAKLDIATQSYDYTQPEWEWYGRPRDQGRSIWTEPYFDEGAGNIHMVTFSVPFFREGRVAGITTVDVDLSQLLNLADISSKEGQEVFVLSKQANFIYRNQPKDISKPLRDVQTDLDAHGLNGVEKLARGPAGLITVTGAGNRVAWISGAPIHTSGWSFLLRADSIDASAGIRDVREQILKLAAAIVLITLAAGWMVWRQMNQRQRAAQTLLTESRQREEAQRSLLGEMQIRSRIAETGSRLREAEEPGGLANVFLSSLSHLMDLSHGALYVARPGERMLRLTGAYGIALDQIGASFGYGEGLVGQCAVDRKTNVLEIPTDGFWHLIPGLEGGMPRWLVITPVIHHDLLLGVLELAMFTRLDARQHEVLEELVDSLALHLKVLLRSLPQDLEEA